MPRYISIIRGINVSGKNKITMDELTKLYESLGFVNVKTYIQSGNVIFDSPNIIVAQLAESIQKKLVKTFGLAVFVLLKTQQELKEIIANNPYLDDKIDPTKLHVTFLFDKPNKERLNKIQNSIDKFCLLDKAIYLYCPNGYGRTKLTNNYFEKILAVSATTRNWKTVNKLYQIANEK